MEVCYAAERNGWLFEGRIERVCYDCSITNSNHYRFDVVISGCCWRIRTAHEVRKTNDYEYQIVSYDGTNIYSFTRFGERLGAINTSQGGVHPSSNPIPSGDSEAMPIWLALASHCYFKNEDKGLAANCWTPFDPLAAQQKWKIGIRKNREFPHLPEHVEFFHDGISRGISSGGELIREPYAPPLSKGFVFRVFSSSNFTNSGRYSFPEMFELQFWRPSDQFIVHGSNGSPLISLSSLIRGVVDKFRVVGVSDSEFVPATDGRTFTSDSRFADGVVSAISYLNTNEDKKWISPDSPVLARLRSQERELRLRQDGEKARAGSSSVKKHLLISGMAGLSLASLVLLIRFDIRRRKQCKE